MKILTTSLLSVAVISLILISLMYFDVIWKSPPAYRPQNHHSLETPIVDMNDYDPSHRRPYIYTVQDPEKGAVYIVGVEHTKDPDDDQLDSIRHQWNLADPTVALVEGRLGFLFSWFQDPVTSHGEGGWVAQMAKQNKVPLYTWEPTRKDEIELLLQDFSVEELALFYSFRPYFSNMRHGKPDQPEEQLQSYLESRTDYAHIRGIYSSWQELDSVWQIHFPQIEWRDYSDEYGWPEGYLSEIANHSNLARDHHMVQCILDLVEKGETVFVIMGSSHAPRIEMSLRSAIEG